MMRDLIARARSSLTGSRRPKSVYLRRAVSDAYYALFHALALLCADQLIGVTMRNSEAWRRVYRGQDHGKTKSELKRANVQSLDPAIARISAAFVQLQEERHNADYDPVSVLRRRSDVEPLILLAETAINDVQSLNPNIRRELAAILIVKARA
jgi:hypothetical protein